MRRYDPVLEKLESVGAHRMTCVIRFVGLANGGTSSIDGTYLMHYDPSPIEMKEGDCRLDVTDSVLKAKIFKDPVEALELWKAVDTRQPFRSDGKPNRPLTAFAVEIVPVEGVTPWLN